MQIQKCTKPRLISESMNSSQESNKNSCCRTCTEKTNLNFLHSLINEVENTPSLSDMLSKVAEIDVKTENDDGFPKHICDCCKYKLKSAYNFVLQAQQSSKYFVHRANILKTQNFDCLQEAPITLTDYFICKSEDYDEYLNIDTSPKTKSSEAESTKIDMSSESYGNHLENVFAIKDEIVTEDESNTEVKSIDLPSPNIKTKNDVTDESKTCQKTVVIEKQNPNEITNKTNNKRYLWSLAAERALLEQWEANLNHFRSSRKNGYVHKQISAELNKLGFIHSAREVQVKINNMAQKFRKENIEIESSSKSQSTWKHYKSVKRIIGSFECNNIKDHETETIDDMDFYEVYIKDSSSSTTGITDKTPLLSLPALPKSLTTTSSLTQDSSSFSERLIPISLESSVATSTPNPKRRKLNYIQQESLTNLKKSTNKISSHLESMTEIEKPQQNLDCLQETPITLEENLIYNSEVHEEFISIDTSNKINNTEAESTEMNSNSGSCRNLFENVVTLKDEIISEEESDTEVKSTHPPPSNIKMNNNEIDKSKNIQNISSNEKKKTMNKKSDKRYSWSSAAEVALLELWEGNLNHFRSSRKNGYAHKQISAQLNKRGFRRTAREVQVKINNMAQKYRKESREIGSLSESQSEWVYYERVQRIIGDFECENIKKPQIETINDKAACLTDPITVKSKNPQSSKIKINHNIVNKKKTYQKIATMQKRRQKEIIDKINIQRYAWSPAAERALLELWQSNINNLNGSRRNGHVHKKISAQLNKSGFAHSAREVQVKINNMTQRYRKENREIGSSSESQSEWVYYESVQNIIEGFNC